MGEYVQADHAASITYLPKFRRTVDCPKPTNNLPKIIKTMNRTKTGGLPKITKTVDHMKIAEDRWIECFRIVDTVLTKIIQVQQLHRDAIWNTCTITDTRTRLGFVEKQIMECKHLEEEMSSLKKIMLERAINSESNTENITAAPELAMETAIIDSPTFHYDLGTEIKCEVDVEANEESKDYSDFGSVEEDIQLPPSQNTKSVEEMGLGFSSEAANVKEQDDSSCTVVFVDTNALVVPEIRIIKSESLKNYTSSSNEYSAAGILQKDESNVKGNSNLWLPEDSKNFLRIEELKMEPKKQPDSHAQLPALSLPERLKNTVNNENIDDNLLDWTAETHLCDNKVSFTELTANSEPSAPEFEPAHHAATAMYCAHCGKVFIRRTNLVAHIRVYHGDGPYKCDVCQKQFNRKESLIVHMSVHTGEKPYSCEICARKFSVIQHLTIHAIRTHGRDQPYTCKYCGTKYTQRRTYIQHMRTVHNDRKPFKCSVCGKQFARSGQLTIHRRIHTGEKPFACKICGNPFRRSSELMQHMRVHNGDKPYKCEICDKRYNQNNNLIVHMRSHTGERPFKCETCEKQFKEKRSLVVHMRMHTGEMPYECELCDTHFRDSRILRLHMERMHSAAKRYKCKLCSERFDEKEGLADHMQSCHLKTYECNLCKRKYTSPRSLHNHMTMHIDAKPHTCEICGIKFEYLAYLKCHKRTHKQK